MIYQQHDFAAGIARLKALGHDDHPDVANLIGYSSRKLGRYDDAKLWYEKALAADPRHARTWSYYGMWHAEQGNLLKARDYLTQVASICGTDCREYVELKERHRGHPRLLTPPAGDNSSRRRRPATGRGPLRMGGVAGFRQQPGEVALLHAFDRHHQDGGRAVGVQRP